MTIGVESVKRLRAHTGAGMMDCKQALSESGGDWDQAVAWLRKKGQKISASRAERAIKEGLVLTRISQDAKQGMVLSVGCETDFVARNEAFRHWAEQVANIALKAEPADINALVQLENGDERIEAQLNEWIAKVGERISFVHYVRLAGEAVIAYQHAGDKLGVLIALDGSAERDTMQRTGKNVAMQIAAMNPIAVSQEGIAQEVIDKELEIGRDIATKEGKPEAIRDKIAQGRLQKFFKENTLLSQSYVKDPKQSVAAYIQSEDKGIRIQAYHRIALG